MQKILKYFVIFSLMLAFHVEAKPDDVKTDPTTTTTLIIKSQPLTVDGKTTAAFIIQQPDGTWGFHGVKGQYFDAIVKNQTDKPTTLHWHGLIVPNNQDGVPDVTQPLIPPGGQYHYHFKLLQSGTYWMHSHYDLQIQQYLSAPFIISDPTEKQDAKEVIMFLADYSHQSPQMIMHDLHSTNSMNSMNHMNSTSSSMNSMSGMMNKSSSQPDLNDVTYDALLTNYRTLKNPEIVTVTPGETIRLRVIDGSAATNFFVNTGQLSGQAIAVDGEAIQPLAGKKFQLAIGQRIDILIKIPSGEGVYPILAQGEGSRLQTGLILKTKNASLSPINETAQTAAGALNYDQELKLKTLHPLAIKPVQQVITAHLEGDMQKYIWKINNQVWPKITPLTIQPHERIEVVFINQTDMAHPMHLHGHVFEVTKINGQPVKDGALRDTVLVLPHTSLSVQFDSNNIGNWMLHCHMLYHQESGMMTIIHYAGLKS